MAQIIPKIVESVERHWQKELADCITDPQELIRQLALDPDHYQQHIAARRLFPMRVPLPFVRRMSIGDPNDPLLRQVMTLQDEFNDSPGFLADPLDEQNNATPGLLHKYLSRVLLMVRTGCAVNCRYCFRRHFPYADNQLSRQQWQQPLAHIAADENINEVIYSGGDPLMAKDEFLAWLTARVKAIPHIKRLRIHSRLPVVIPGRITEQMVEWFAGSGLQTVLVVHINHSNEIDHELVSRLSMLKEAGVTLLNQAVLLRGVNDSAEAQIALSERLFEAGVLPYYLHMLDKVKGASHFEVDEQQGRQLMAEIIRRLPGFLVPKLVREIGGQPGKTPVDLRLQP